MRRAVIVGAVLLLVAWPGVASSPEGLVASQAVAANAVLWEGGVADGSDAIAKAVPRKDKATFDVIGFVLGGIITESGCGNPGLSGPVVFLQIRTKGSPLGLVGVGCAGKTFGACSTLRIGQRVRLQGTMVLMPDFTRADFVACDPATWVPFEVPLNVFVATKVAK